MKKVLFTLTIGLIILFSVGCWNQRELNDLAIAMPLGFDKVEDAVNVTIQVVLPEEAKEPSYYTPVTVYTETAGSVFEAFRKMTTQSPRKIYLPHFRVMVINEELAREGIIETLDMLVRDHELRSDFFIVVAKDGYEAEDILEIMTPFERIPANEMFSALQTSQAAWAPTTTILLDELLTNLVTEGKEAVLTGVTIYPTLSEKGKAKENVERIDPNSVLKASNVGVFKGDKLVGWLNEDESKGFNYIIGNVQSTVGRIECPTSGELVVEIKGVEEKIIPHVINGKPEIEIDLTIYANIGEVLCTVDLTDPEVIKELEKSMEDQLQEVVQSSIVTSQEKYGSDIFGFGNAIRKKYPKQWKTLKDNWDEEFSRLPITYSMKGVIEITGTVDQSFFKKFKEMDEK